MYVYLGWQPGSMKGMVYMRGMGVLRQLHEERDGIPVNDNIHGEEVSAGCTLEPWRLDHACPECGKCFATKSGMSQHKRHVHWENVNEERLIALQEAERNIEEDTKKTRRKGNIPITAADRAIILDLHRRYNHPFGQSLYRLNLLRRFGTTHHLLQCIDHTRYLLSERGRPERIRMAEELAALDAPEAPDIQNLQTLRKNVSMFWMRAMGGGVRLPVDKRGSHETETFQPLPTKKASSRPEAAGTCQKAQEVAANVRRAAAPVGRGPRQTGRLGVEWGG